jgi:hypothetical protein
MGLSPLGLLLLVATGLATPPTCRVSEFFCDTGQCVALDRFCDGEDDCGDKSDEPRYCSREYDATDPFIKLSACCRALVLPLLVAIFCHVV